MPRQLKTYVTTSGFFELAVAAPTMKAALEIWGAGPDLFRRGYAKETRESAIVKATMAKPGAVLKRAVGGQGPFKAHAGLPDVSMWKKPARKSAPPDAEAPQPEPPRRLAPVKKAPVKATPPKPSAAEREAARLSEAAQKKREREAARAEAAQRKALALRKKAMEKAEKAMREASAAHDEIVLALEKERRKLDQRALEEDERWETQKRELDAALRDAQ